LQSAAASGAGGNLVFGLVGGTATAVAVAATAPGVIKAFNEGEDENATDTDGEKEQ
jgi:hypothetical protein